MSVVSHSSLDSDAAYLSTGSDTYRKNATGNTSIDQLRAKHLRAKEALRKTTSAAAVAAVMARRQVSEPPQVASPGLASRQCTQDSADEGRWTPQQPPPAASRWASNLGQTQSSLSAHNGQDALRDTFADLADNLRTDAEKLATAARELREESARDVAELQLAVEAQGTRLKAMRSRDIVLDVRALRECVDNGERMDARRAEETLLALDRLDKSIVQHSTLLEELRVNEMHAGLALLQENLELHHKSLAESAPQFADVHSELREIKDAAGVHGASLQDASLRIAAQHREQVREVQQLREGLAVHSKYEGLRAALNSEVERESAEQLSREAAVDAWTQEKRHLENEVSRLTRRTTALAGELKKATGSHPTASNQGLGPLLPWIIAAAVGAVVALISLGCRLVLHPPDSDHNHQHDHHLWASHSPDSPSHTWVMLQTRHDGALARRRVARSLLSVRTTTSFAPSRCRLPRLAVSTFAIWAMIWISAYGRRLGRRRPTNSLL